MIKSFVRYLLSLLGKKLIAFSAYQMLIQERDALRELHRHVCSHPPTDWTHPTSEGIVFSKDRAFQLDALLRSFLELCEEKDSRLNVLYTCSSTAHEAAYRELQARVPSNRIAFYRETAFRDNLLSILNRGISPAIYFLVDDNLFVRPFSLRCFASFPLFQYVPSLRMGEHHDYCYTRSKHQKIPQFEKVNWKETLYLSWHWRQEEHDWNFPLSVDGHFFDRGEILIMSRHSNFHSPNSLETSLQTYVESFLDRTGIALPEPRLINIPWNRVQNENKNRHGKIDNEALLQLWQNGKQLEIAAYRNIQTSGTHQELPLNIETRLPL